MSHSLLSHSFFTSATLFLSRLSNPTLYSGWSVGPPSLAFLAHMSGSCSTSASQIHGQPITAPAHPHATLVAVYPGLFFFVLLSLHCCRILLALLHLLLAPFLPTISSSPHSETFREAPASFRVTALLVTPKNTRLSPQFSKANLTDLNLIGKLEIERKYIHATTRRINIKISKIRPGKFSGLTSEK